VPPQVASKPMKTRMIRTPVTGPDPANTLVHLEGRAPGLDGGGIRGKWDRQELAFLSEFRIDGYQQADHEWYLENTLVSATAMLRMLNTETDLVFAFAVDRIEPSLALDGTLGFTIAYSQYIDDDAVFPPTGMVTQLGATVSAYVLCFEPRAERPPHGRQHGTWGRLSERLEMLEGHRWSAAASTAGGTFRRRFQDPQMPFPEERC
jgi:hypothetical protein